MQSQCAVQTGILTSFQNLMYRIIHDSLTQFTKLVSLNGKKDSNMRPTDGKRNFPSFFIPSNCTMRLPIVTGRCQSAKPFSPIPDAASHSWFLRWLRWFNFADQAGPVVHSVQWQHP